MKKIFDFTKKEKNKGIRNVGHLAFNSVSNKAAELCFYGDIVSNTWQSYWYEEDKSPQDIADFLNELDDFESVDIYINSGGGSVHGGLAIYNILKRYQGYKTCYVDGLAASIASVILLSGDTIISPTNGQMMIHKPWSYSIGNADDFRKEADVLDACQKAITNVYMEHVQEGVTRETIERLVNAETWLTGDEIAKYFKVNISGSTETFNCISDYFDEYKKNPFKQKNKEEKEKLQLQLDLLQL